MNKYKIILCNSGEITVEAASYRNDEVGYLYFISEGEVTHTFSHGSWVGVVVL